jgi:hypothetical protein
MSVLILALVACTGGTVALDVPTDDTASNADDTGSGDDTGDTQDTEPQAHAAAGDWSGDLAMLVVEWDWDLCEGEWSIEVDEEGAFEGQAECEPERGEPFEGTLSGEIDEDGDVTGTIEWEVSWGGGGGGDTYDGDLGGSVEEDDAALQWTLELNFGRGGDTEVQGEGEGERD